MRLLERSIRSSLLSDLRACAGRLQAILLPGIESSCSLPSLRIYYPLMFIQGSTERAMVCGSSQSHASQVVLRGQGCKSLTWCRHCHVCSRSWGWCCCHCRPGTGTSASERSRKQALDCSIPAVPLPQALDGWYSLNRCSVCKAPFHSSGLE